MKKPSAFIVSLSLLLGVILTALFLTQTAWRPFHDCQNPAATASTEGCAIMTYGYPKRFITTDLNVGEQNVVFATTELNQRNAAINWLFWSVVSFIALSLATGRYKPAATKPKPTKKTAKTAGNR